MAQHPMALTNKTPTSSQTLGLLSDTSFTQLVNDAFRNYQSTLALSRSPLANSTLVTPTLVLDDTSPTAEERGRGLRLVLRWAVDQMAPGPVTYPWGKFRPLDDPTWSEPLWWRYNILRHRYLEPLHPDDFVEGGRYTETLMALTGITSSDAFFDERNRAIREVAERLRQQLIDGTANGTLQQMALAEIVRLLDIQEDAAQLLGIAAIFDDIFPSALLLSMAQVEQVPNAERALDYLITRRLLLAGDARRSLWLSSTLRSYIYQRHSLEKVQRRHRLAARYYMDADTPLTTARHWLRAGLHERAATLLFQNAETLVNELQITELCQLLQQFTKRDLVDATWREVQILLSDLYYRSGQPEDALAACRHALKATHEPADQARIYRRMGKLYVTRNQLHALTYYQQAAERFAPTSPELVDLLKDRGWLHILRHNWAEAEQDLTLALSINQSTDAALQADIIDALASLYRRQKRFPVALEHAQQALSIREQLGNLPRIASSFNNLGNIYRHLGEYGHAISAYEEALVTYRKLGNQASTAGALMNIGSSYFSLGRLADAVQHYQQSLATCAQLGQPHVEATAHYNLAEAYAKMERQPEAIDHWARGYDLSQRAGFADEVSAFEQLRAEVPLLQVCDERQRLPPARPLMTARTAPALPADEQAILELAQTYGRITAKLVTEELGVSRATATRRLSALAEEGHLTQHGQGRGTHYTFNAQITQRETPPDGVPTSIYTAEPACPAATAPAIELETQLAAHRAVLQKRFAVTAVALASTPPPSPMLRLTVQFAQMPSLPEFWELRAYLTDITGTDVDLWPQL